MMMVPVLSKAADAPAPVVVKHDMAAMPAMAAAVTADKTSLGTVKSVSVADQAKGTKSEIVVIGADTKTTDFLVTATTTLYGTDAKAITLDKIAANAKVAVLYEVSKEGMNIAKSVKIVM